MANENEKEPKNQLEELYAWISGIPLSKPTKNLARDFSDSVMMAEILKIYYPRYVDLHNYVPASSLTTKRENWNILNRKVLRKIDMKLTKDVIKQVASCHPGVAENILLELRSKILKNFVPQNPQDLPCNGKENDSIEEDKAEENSMKVTASENSVSCAVHRSTVNSLDCRRSMLTNAINKFYLLLRWFIGCFCIWNYLPKLRIRLRNRSQNSREGVEAKTSENVDEEDAVPRHICAQLLQKLQEIDNIIATLNHKAAYLESAMKLKDQRITSLTSQILQNTVESDQLGKIQANNT